MGALVGGGPERCAQGLGAGGWGQGSGLGYAGPVSAGYVPPLASTAARGLRQLHPSLQVGKPCILATLKRQPRIRTALSSRKPTAASMGGVPNLEKKCPKGKNHGHNSGKLHVATCRPSKIIIGPGGVVQTRRKIALAISKIKNKKF